jgi:hypothetical protein
MLQAYFGENPQEARYVSRAFALKDVVSALQAGFLGAALFSADYASSSAKKPNRILCKHSVGEFFLCPVNSWWSCSMLTLFFEF